MNKEERKIIKEQYKKVKQYLNKRYILEPMIKKEKKKLGRELTNEEMIDISHKAVEEVKRRREEKGV